MHNRFPRLGFFAVLTLVSSSGIAKDTGTHNAIPKKSPWFRWSCDTVSSSHLKLTWDIDSKGKPFNIQVDPSTTTSGSLLSASIAAVEKWRYKPAMENGKPVDSPGWSTSYDFNCTQQDVDETRAANEQARIQARYRQLAGLYMMACKDPDIVTCTAWAALQAQRQMQGDSTSTTEDQGKIMLFGGPNHKTYLGCLNCSETAIDSIMNESGEYGNRYSWKSVLNKNGEFGSPNSSEGICNPFATDPPVIVDQQGGFYGRFTISEVHPERTRIPQLQQVVAMICSSY